MGSPAILNEYRDTLDSSDAITHTSHPLTLGLIPVHSDHVPPWRYPLATTILTTTCYLRPPSPATPQYTIAGDNHGKAIGESNRIDVLPPRQAAANLRSPSSVSGG